MKRVVYRYDPLKLAGANLGIDPEASGEAFREVLERALEAEWPGATIEVVQGPPGCELEGFENPSLAELRVEGLARGVRKAASWIVYY